MRSTFSLAWFPLILATLASCSNGREPDLGGTNPCEGMTCGANATCSGGSCHCDDGYSWQGNSCVDVDECASAIAECDTNADCTNVPGSFTCTCRAGFTGSGFHCDDIDECSAALDACHPDALCGNVPGGYSCSCQSPMVGDGFTCVRPWSDPVLVGLPLGEEHHPSYARAELAADAAGNLLIALVNAGQSIHVRRYDSATASWSELFDLTGSIFQAGTMPLVDVDATGNGIVVFNEANDWEGGRILAMRYDAARPFATGWSATPEEVAGSDAVLVQRVRRLEMDDAGNVLVVVGALRNDGPELLSVSEVRVAPAGETFGTAVRIPGVPDFASVATRSTTTGFELLAAWADSGGVHTQAGRFDLAIRQWSWEARADHAAAGEEAVAGLDVDGGSYVAWLEGERWVNSWVRVRHAPAGAAWGGVTDLDVYPDEKVGAVVPESLLLQAGRSGEAQVLFRSVDSEGTYGHVAEHLQGAWKAPLPVDETGSNSVAWIEGARSATGLALVAWDRRDAAGRYEVVVRVSVDGVPLEPAHVFAAGEATDRYWARVATRPGGAAAVWAAESTVTHDVTNEAAILTFPGKSAP